MWLLGKAVSPFVVVVFSWLVGRPVNCWVRARVPSGGIKRWLLAEMDDTDKAGRRRYAIGCAVLLIGLYGGIVWATWP